MKKYKLWKITNITKKGSWKIWCKLLYFIYFSDIVEGYIKMLLGRWKKLFMEFYFCSQSNIWFSNLNSILQALPTIWTVKKQYCLPTFIIYGLWKYTQAFSLFDLSQMNTLCLFIFRRKNKRKIKREIMSKQTIYQWKYVGRKSSINVFLIKAIKRTHLK